MKVSTGNDENSGYDPETGTNWCNLPMELRMKCIGEMDFKSRACLRGTSTTEKALVESKKYLIQDVYIDRYNFSMTSILHGEVEPTQDENMPDSQKKTREEARKQLLLLKLVFKLSEIDTLFVFNNGLFEPEDLVGEMIINCCELWFYGDIKAATLVFILKSLKTIANKIDFGDVSDLPLVDLADLPAIYTAKTLVFYALDCTCWFPRILKHWINGHAQVGNRISFSATGNTSFKNILRDCGDHVIDKTDRKIRLATRCGKQIIIKWSQNDFEECIKCEVIPGEL